VRKANGLTISMDCEAGWVGNAFVERLWRSVKYEHIYLRTYDALGPTFRTWQILRFLQYTTHSHCVGPTHPGCDVLRAC